MSGDITIKVVDATKKGGGRIVGTMTVRPASDLADLAERTHCQLQDLGREPTRERCDLMIRALADCATQVHRLRDSLPK